MNHPSPLGVRRTYFNVSNLPFWGVHVAAIVGVLLLGFSWTGLALAASAYVARMFFVTAGYHRYFSHRSYKTSRWFQFVLALLSATGAQRGVLWWAANHRKHHRESDTPADPHSARQRGFWWSHMGWMLSCQHDDTDVDEVRDLNEYPELRLLDRFHFAAVVLLAVAFFSIGGAHALVWGFFVSTVLLWHGTFTINSLAHLIGRRRYKTGDDSRNSFGLALITLGEGWHNNHHYYQSAAKQGFFWWELDLTMIGLRMMQRVGLVWDLRAPPQHTREGRLRRGQPVTELVAEASEQAPAQLPQAPLPARSDELSP